MWQLLSRPKLPELCNESSARTGDQTTYSRCLLRPLQTLAMKHEICTTLLPTQTVSAEALLGKSPVRVMNAVKELHGCSLVKFHPPIMKNVNREAIYVH